MTLSFQPQYAWQGPIQISSSERETFTQSAWSDLIIQARRAKVPYLPVAVCHLENGDHKLYDAIFLDRYLKRVPSAADPLTRHKIQRIEYFYTKIINSKKKNYLFYPCQFSKTKLAIEACNIHIQDVQEKNKLAKCQFVVGVQLLNEATTQSEQEESRRWLRLASANGF